MLSNKGNVSCPSKQEEPLTRFELTPDKPPSIHDEFDTLTIFCNNWFKNWMSTCLRPCGMNPIGDRQIHGFELGCDYDIIHHKGGYWNCRSNMSLSSCLLVTLMKQHLDVCTNNVGTQQRRQRIATFDIAIHNR